MSKTYKRQTSLALPCCYIKAGSLEGQFIQDLTFLSRDRRTDGKARSLANKTVGVINWHIYLTIIPRARMGYESIAHEAAIDSEVMRVRGIIVLIKSN